MLLQLNDVHLSFTRYDTGLTRRDLPILNGVDFDVEKGELVAMVGASGAGKSVLAHAILGILPGNARVSGDIRFKGETVTPKQQKRLRGREICLIPQSVSFLDPLQKVGKQVRRAAVLSGVNKRDANRVQRQVFDRYQLPDDVARLFPFQLSGGMARRVLVATATVGDADLVIADEPTPGLHPDIVRQSLQHLRELADSGKGCLLISHDLASAFKVADRVAVFYAGMVVEEARVSDFSDNGERLRHPFTRGLWTALPRNDFSALSAKQDLPEVSSKGCPFIHYCSKWSTVCVDQLPASRELAGGRVRCHHA